MTRPSLTQLALAAVAHRCSNGVEPTAPEAHYLAGHAQGLPSAPAEMAALIRAALQKPAAEDVPLAHLATAWALSLAESLSLALAAVVERDLEAGRAIAYVQSPVGGSRPTLGLLAAAFGPFDGPRELNALQLANRPAFLSGALTLLNDGAPLPERPVALSLPLGLSLTGEEAPWPGGVVDSASGHVPLPESVLARCRREGKALASDDAPVLVLRSVSLEETRAVAAEIAGMLHRRSFIAENVAMSGLAAWLLLRELVPVFVIDPAPTESKTVPVIPLYQGPVIVAAGLEGVIEAPGRTVTNWTLPLPELEEREALWKKVLPHGDVARELALSHRISTARIAQLGKLATHRAQAEDRSTPTAATVRAISRSGEGSGLESLAQLVSESIPDEAFVANAELRAQLEALLERCRRREGLTKPLGVSASARYTPGVRTLFVGPSGTGKTMAAGWLATKLGLPLYRVDLANINSKYIGETEKNLSRLLARAERTEAVLLFDEADSLFGQRTEVKESNDRFANAQTNYLLQRMETFDSIAILTSNSRGRFDTAFARRIDPIIEFPSPAPADRRALWLAHLGEGHSLSMQELNLLAGQCDFAGGQIYNVVLTAEVAAQGNGKVIDLPKLLQALQAEYRKAGRMLPPGLAAAARPAATATEKKVAR